MSQTSDPAEKAAVLTVTSLRAMSQEEQERFQEWLDAWKPPDWRIYKLAAGPDGRGLLLRASCYERPYRWIDRRTLATDTRWVYFPDWPGRWSANTAEVICEQRLRAGVTG